MHPRPFVGGVARARPGPVAFLLVPSYSLASYLWNSQPLRTKELSVTIAISMTGYTCNRFAVQFVFGRSDVVSFVSASVDGLLRHICAKLFNGTSLTIMDPRLLFLVPGGIAAAGGLTVGGGTHGYNAGLLLGLRMGDIAVSAHRSSLAGGPGSLPLTSSADADCSGSRSESRPALLHLFGTKRANEGRGFAF